MKPLIYTVFAVASLLVVSAESPQRGRGADLFHSFDDFDSAPFNPLATGLPDMRHLEYELYENEGQGSWSFTMTLGDRELLADDSGKPVICLPTSLTYTGPSGADPLAVMVIGSQLLKAYQPWRWEIPEVIGLCAEPEVPENPRRER